MNERGQRISGIRAKAIEASLAIPFLMAACGGTTPTETQKPTNQPTENPTPSIVLPSETPSVTIKPTVEPTLKPTPEPTLIPIATMIAEVPLVVSFEEFKDTAQTIYNNSQEAKSLIPQEVFDEELSNCQGANGARIADRKAGCFTFIQGFYQLYKQTKDPVFYEGTQSAYDFSVSSKGPYSDNKAELDSLITSILS